MSEEGASGSSIQLRWASKERLWSSSRNDLCREFSNSVVSDRRKSRTLIRERGGSSGNAIHLRSFFTVKLRLSYCRWSRRDRMLLITEGPDWTGSVTSRSSRTETILRTKSKILWGLKLYSPTTEGLDQSLPNANKLGDIQMTNSNGALETSPCVNLCNWSCVVVVRLSSAIVSAISSVPMEGCLPLSCN